MRKRSPNRSRMSIGLIEIVRAAASSMPSGSPSRLRQISTTAAAVAGSAKSMRDWSARARSTNNVTAGELTPPSSVSGSSSRRCSPGNVDGLAGGGEHAQAGRPREQLAHGLRDRVDEVLAVVQHDQRAPPRQGLDQCLDRPAVRRLMGDAQGGRDRVRHCWRGR